MVQPDPRYCSKSFNRTTSAIYSRQRCAQIPIEFVVRGYITGSTKTSIWTHYKNGSRNYCGNELPEGLVKNQRLETPLLTPTTKGGIGIFSDTTDDVPITPDEIVERGVITRDQLRLPQRNLLQTI